MENTKTLVAKKYIDCPMKGQVEADDVFESTCEGCPHFVSRTCDWIHCDYEEKELKQYVVNIFGGPCAGKTANMLLVAGKMKKRGVKIEFADEWIKGKVYDKSPYPFADQFYTFSKQRKKLLERLAEKRLEVIVTDSPILLSAVYLQKPDELFEKLILREFNNSNNINIYLQRSDEYEYDPVGRNQDEEGAKEVDVDIKKYLDEHDVPYISVLSRNDAEDEILDIIMKHIKIPPNGSVYCVPKIA